MQKVSWYILAVFYCYQTWIVYIDMYAQAYYEAIVSVYFLFFH